MALIPVDTNQTAAAYDLGTTDSLHLFAGVTISSEGNAITASGTGQRVILAGTVLSFGTGVILASSGGTQFLTITSTGVLQSSSAAVVASGFSRIVNSGEITSDSFGVQLSLSAGEFSSARNSGTISGVEAVRFDGAADARFDLFNFGSIYGVNYAVLAQGEGTLVVLNRGQIFGDVGGSAGSDSFTGNANSGNMFLGDGTDSVNLSGEVAGTQINLGAGSDSYGGANLTGEVRVLGEEGADIFALSDAAEAIFGGSGTDTVTLFTAKAGVTLALQGPFHGTGVLQGDVIFDVENVFATPFADRITGSTAANSLNGGIGNDTIAGGGGADSLDGSTGRDRLTGGAGNDSFVYVRPSEAGGDVITDFSGAAGNNDRFDFVAAGGWGGLGTGTLTASRFQSRADNLAQDANDRFIFRTTDKTLWFDANGNAAGGLTLIADLQQSAVVTAADIVLV